MSIASETNKVIYSCNGSTTEFDYTFKIFDDDEIEVILYTIADGTETVLTIDTHYTVDDVGEDAGGTVTTVATYSSAYKLILRRKIPLTQTADYVANDDFPAETHEEALDRIVMQIQQQQEQLDRSLLRDASQSASLTIPAAVANTVIGWDSAGTGLENKTLVDLSAVAKAETADAEAGTDDTKYMTPAKVKAEVQKSGAVAVPIGNLPLTAILSAAMPVGFVVTLGVATNPATLFGFGTWTAIAGKVIVGINAGDTEFDTLDETGGEKTHILTAAEIAKHTHPFGVVGTTAPGNSYISGHDVSGSEVTCADYIDQQASGDGAHNNLQPYIVKYVWQRTA
jgi:hypothetical protein